MQASIVIPVWNGADVIAGCLDALYAHADDLLGEVICVDNASPDGAGDFIATVTRRCVSLASRSTWDCLGAPTSAWKLPGATC